MYLLYTPRRLDDRSRKLANEGRYDYLLIESTGISEPVPVAQTFSFVSEDDNIDLSKFSYIDTMVKVVDCFNFFKDFGTSELLIDRKLTNMEDDFRTIVNLLTDQVEFANVIILNKTDLVDASAVGLLKAFILKLNPNAKIITSDFSRVSPKEILNTNLFDFEEAQNSAGWQKELEGGTHTPETEEYGISSFVFRGQKPFHPERFWKYLNEEYPNNIIRTKGLFWLASRPEDAINFSQAGGSSRIERAGVWWASMTLDERTNYQSFIDNREFIESKWSEQWGDRMNELVFIGQDIEKEKMISDLEKCLLQDKEQYMFENKLSFIDPFPQEM